MKDISKCYEFMVRETPRHGDIFVWSGQDIAVYGNKLSIHLDLIFEKKITTTNNLTNKKDFERSIYRRKR